MAENQMMDVMWDDSPVDVSTEVNFIWSIANKLRGTYQSDKYKDVMIPMVIIRRFECALEETKEQTDNIMICLWMRPCRSILPSWILCRTIS